MVCRESIKRLALTCALLGAGVAFAQTPLPEQDARVHEGVASCANTVCHGRVNKTDEGPVWLNEYRVWLRQDYHSRAYRTLLTQQSKDIAEKLGLPAAHTADICLDCHADNVPVEKRGRRFQIDDGVGCEACHGGSEQWLESHAEQGTNHKDNIAKGLYPTERPHARAQLCLSCHMGTTDKLATHNIMGAGHPRLSFELETFGVNQPAHYSLDADYQERKRASDAVATWLTGLSASSAQMLALLGSGKYSGSGLFPELSFFQCHACHHGMDTLRWQTDSTAAALGPGDVRLNDGPMLVLASTMRILEPELGLRLLNGTRRLHAASLQSPAALQAAAIELQSEFDQLARRLGDMRFDQSQREALRRHLLGASAAGEFHYYTAAEQVFLGIETLSIELNTDTALEAELDALFAALQNETGYIPEQFSVAARRMLEAL